MLFYLQKLVEIVYKPKNYDTTQHNLSPFYYFLVFQFQFDTFDIRCH